MGVKGGPAHPGGRLGGNSRCASLQLFFQKFDHIVKTAFVGVAYISQGLMSGEHVLGLNFFAFGGGFAAVLQRVADFLAFGLPEIAVTVEFEDVIQSKAGEQLQIALVGVDDAQGSTAGFAEVQGSARQHAEKGGIHHRAAFEVDDEIAHALGNHALDRLLGLETVLKGASAIHPHPENAADGANKNMSGRSHALGGLVPERGLLAYQFFLASQNAYAPCDYPATILVFWADDLKFGNVAAMNVLDHLFLHALGET